MKKEVAKRAAHRPRKFESGEKLQKAIDLYFKKCDEKSKPYTVMGLCLTLDIDRKTLLNWEKEEEFFHIVKRAKYKIAEMLEEKLHSHACTGAMFNLKCNFGFIDKQEIDIKQTNYTLKTFKPAEEPKMIEIPNEKS